MFWKKPKTEKPTQPPAEKLPGPRSIEELVGRHMILDLKKDPDWVWKLSSVVRRREGGKHRFDFRVFDADQVAEKGVKVENYDTFEQHPKLILYRGWFDKVSMEVHFQL